MQVAALDFKTQFPRFTPAYLPLYQAGKTYFNGDIVYYTNTAQFYKCKVTNTTSIPTTTSDWSLYNDSTLNYTQDGDIIEAINEALVNFNENLFPDNNTAKLVFLYLAAHYLTVDFRNALGMGIAGIVTSKSVGSVSESYTIPQWLLNNSALAPYATTGYGIKYASLLRPYLIGNVMLFRGKTTIG